MHSYRIMVFVAAVSVWPTITSWAATCTVPSGGHPTIQAAVDDPTCSVINLQSQTYQEEVAIGRTVSISGVSSSTSIIVGQVQLEGGSPVVTMTDIGVDASNSVVAGCYRDAVLSRDGARLVGNNLVVVNATGVACLLFGNGFENGNTAAWSATTP